MSKMDEKDLKAVLSALFDEMKEKGQIGPGVDKDTLIKTVTDNIMETLDKEGLELQKSDLKENPAIVKGLKLCLTSESINLSPELTNKPKETLGYNLLFKDLRHLDPKELEEHLKKSLTELNNKLTPGGPQPKLSEKELDAAAEGLANDLTNKAKQDGQDQLVQNQQSVDLIAELTIGSLFGVLPTSGVATSPTVIMGNLEGYALPQLQAGKALTYMNQANAVEPGQFDPNSTKAFVLSNAISNATLGDDVQAAIDHVLHPSPNLTQTH